MEAELGLDPQRCGTMVTDELMDKNDLVELRKMAIRLIDKLGDTTFRNRESINLKWINLHNVFRKGPQAKVFREKDFQLINKAAERARVSLTVLKMFVVYSENLCIHFTRKNLERCFYSIRTSGRVHLVSWGLPIYSLQASGSLSRISSRGQTPFTKFSCYLHFVAVNCG